MSFIKGLCGVKLNKEHYPKHCVLNTCPYTHKKLSGRVTIDGKDQKYPLTPEQTLEAKCPECSLADINLSKHKIYNETLAYTKIILHNKTKTDQKFLANVAYERLPENCPPGHSWTALILASIYLASKCPANSDTPLKTSEIVQKISPFLWYSGNILRHIRTCATILRQQGHYSNVCIVTPLQYIVSKKQEIKQHLTESQYNTVTDHAKQISETEPYHIWRQGKNPSVIAGATIYAIVANQGFIGDANKPLAISQVELARIFHITAVSMRSKYPIIQGFLDQLKEDSAY